MPLDEIAGGSGPPACALALQSILTHTTDNRAPPREAGSTRALRGPPQPYRSRIDTALVQTAP
ncbi:hypothetical protein TPA0906_43540 [Streptomyces olivaceus]|nr:hypothetical protein TPA0905_02460 [Streptomyces olivaceus]GHJ02489.1 hypothetical protein TPA0906_43540 [Streptomyces olivaceus]